MPEGSISLAFPRADVAVVSLTGAHDLATARQMVETFEELVAARTGLVADLSGLTFFDTTTIHALVVGRKLALANGVRFVITVPGQHPVTRMLDLMRVLDLWPVSDTVDDAIAVMSGDQVEGIRPQPDAAGEDSEQRLAGGRQSTVHPRRSSQEV